MFYLLTDYNNRKKCVRGENDRFFLFRINDRQSDLADQPLMNLYAEYRGGIFGEQ